MRKHYSPTLKAKVVLELLKEEKPLTQIASEQRIHPTQLRDWKKQALEGLPNLFADSSEAARATAHLEHKQDELYAEIGRLTTQVGWLKKNLALNLPRRERVSLVDWEDRALPLVTQAELLSLNRSSLYYQPVPPSLTELHIKRRIDEIYTAWPFYGSRKITVELNKEMTINRKAVQHHMREMGLSAICPGPNLSKRHHDHVIFPYLLRNVTAAYPNHVWGIDITYIRLRTGWLYLVAVLDWYSRYVISWALDDTLEMPFVLDTVERALAQATPTIWNSDQGSQFTSPQYIDRLRQAQVQISMDGKGRALDNIFTERLWRTVKYEEVYLQDYAQPKEAGHRIALYFDFYNHRRSHQSLNYQTPAQVYFVQEVRPH